jgi:2-oxoglutarate/2-oxoacid ferredoxin oxidoreductase subunit beta
MLTVSDYDNGSTPSWCPGCGNYAILASLQQALVELDLRPCQVLIVSGIGQAAKLPHYMKCNAINGLHGRSLPLATAAKLANQRLVVIVVGGDGDCYAEGGNHLIHAIRRNPDITLLVHNNQVFGLTRGQAAPTAERGFVTKMEPQGVMLPPFNPLALAISQDASFVGRGYAGNGEQLNELIKAAIRNPGFALIDILQPCVSFDHRHTYAWYGERVYQLDRSHDPSDKFAAYHKAEEWGEKIPLGIFFQKPRPAYGSLKPVLGQGPLLLQPPTSRAAMETLFDAFL